MTPDTLGGIVSGGVHELYEVPSPGKESSSPFILEHLEIATGFVDELISLGVLSLISHGAEIFNTCPLFLVPKSGQPGKWRCIADMKKGVQNTVCVPDMVHIPQPDDILPHLYTDGCSVTIDASKFFTCSKLWWLNGHSWE
jgi:hypothetical protein